MSTVSPPLRHLLTIGLTGGIGSGKSAVSDQFARLGATVVDTDVLAHQLTGPDGAAIEALRDAFGDHVLTAENSLDRSTMRSLVFSDATARQRLEAILHPLIRALALQACIQASGDYVILVVPLLIESNSYRQQVNRICVVDCPESMQISRVASRSGLPEAQIRAIMSSQCPRALRLAAADDVIDNSTTLSAMQEQVAQLHGCYMRLARAHLRDQASLG